MIVPIALGAAALWVFYRRREGLPILPHLFGPVAHVEVITPVGPALIPASTQVVPVAAVSPTLALAAAATPVDTGIHAPRYIVPDPGIHAPRTLASGDMKITIDHQAVGQMAFLPAHQRPQQLAFDIYGHQSAPRSLRVDEFGILRSSLSRPFGVR